MKHSAVRVLSKGNHQALSRFTWTTVFK